MDYGDSALCGSGELELDPDIVSEEAGKLYSELQSVVETHGAGVVESLLPILVWVLEGLASCRAQLREREEEAEKEKDEREELLERYQSEKTLRRESQERYLELDDQFEQERRAMRAREKEREKRERELEKKAREQADQLMALEEQKANLTRELNSIKHTHNKLVLTHRDLLEKKKEWESEAFTFRNHVHRKHSEAVSTQGQTETSSEEHDPKAGSAPDSTASEMSKVTDAEADNNNGQSFISDIISSTPELAHLKGFIQTSSTVCSKTATSDFNSTLLDEMNQAQEDKREVDEDQKVKDGEKMEEEEMDDDSDCLEWELRNTDSVFSELSELSSEYVENVDRGASVRDSTEQFEQILSQYEELKTTHEMVDAARKALISRVEEVTSERSALTMELDSCRETISRLEGKTKEMEDEIKRLRKELETISEDPDASLPTSLRRFSRSEMARVVMEKNQYKERLFELQEAMRRAQLQSRVTKEERPPVEGKGSVWSRFNRFLGLTKGQLAPASAVALTISPTAASAQTPVGSPQKLPRKSPQTESSPSPRLRKRELYREIRSHVWGTLGKKQLHGWSMPLCVTNIKDSELPPEPKDVPVLIQLRLLDQRDSTAKLTCAVAVPPEISGEQTCSVWAVTGPASSSDVTVIDPARSNTILDQFSLPPTSPALCICAVPPAGDTAGTVWIGTLDGGVLIHSSSSSRRRCLQSVSLSEGVHSLTYSQGEVIAGLANGTLAFFTHSSGVWNLQSQEVLSLGTPPLQPVRCCLAKEGCLWVGYWNKVYMISVKIRKVEKSFTVSERSEQQVRFLCAAGSGVWAACRLDPILRLFDWTTGRPLQEVDLSSIVTKALGSAFLSLSPLQITALSVVSGRLWVGTGSGAIFSVPLSLTSESCSIPYCSLASAQLCYHGHRQAVKFIISAPGCRSSSSSADGAATTSQLILSGGEGYINFRIGDDGSDGANESVLQRSERSHMIIWQSPTPSVPNPAL
ncbi:C-Jun-amino-terminal kinase-interacting protein 4-like isoform X1 [Carassius auratus]|uniref:C-Jun-amino-terminal kinase-interacting protein 4-like isoform X1 n=1 Tax=Carassius auratus TaxID=7957 RepID=A0A6P6R3F4_CARAU|nr:C-Jun-amino-terminal kinase-interacting protein 4-like isoform X1 [Carassius auratus]